MLYNNDYKRRRCQFQHTAMRSLVLLLSAIVGIVLSERNCTRPGIILSSDPHKFLVCIEKDGKLLTVENQCSKGLVFDIVHKRCTKMPILTAFYSVDVVVDVNTTNQPTTPQSTTWNPPTTASPPAPLPCKNPGAMCDTCNTLSFCVGTPTSNNSSRYYTKKILSLTCETGSVCVTKRGCVQINNGGLCLQGKFKCGDVGTYPDLYDCTKYHVCDMDSNGLLVDYEKQCANGIYGNRWSPVNSQCGWAENVEACQGYPVPACEAELQMGSAGGQIYYICMVDVVAHELIPVMFRCQGNLVFDPTSVSCVESLP